MNARIIRIRPVMVATAMLCFGSAMAQTFKEWDDVSVTNLNRETAHTVCIPMQDEAAVNEGAMEKSPYYQSLNGVWKFKWVADPNKCPTGFEQPGYADQAWDDIDVPAAWQVYGIRHSKQWDKPLYTNVPYPFSFDENTWSVMASRPSWFQYNDNMKNPVGSYRRTFTVPSDWQGRDVYIRLNGAGHGYYLWINGHFVGYAEDSYTPSEFKITDYLQDGDNTVALRVYRFTSGSFLEDQDYWRMTGITRDVFIWSAPKTQIRDFFATTPMSNNYTQAKVNVDVKLEGEKLSNPKLSLKVMDGTSVVAENTIDVDPNAKEQNISVDMASPKLWSAEEPNLYNLVLTLMDGNQVVDLRGCKLGVRQIDVRNDGAITVNGQPLLIHGVNRHDHSPLHGRAVTREEMEKDVLLMKRLNINAIRTSHYPNNPYLYELCNKYGLYVLAEANVECHGKTSLSSVEAFRKPMVERNVNHVQWLKNYSCICIWSYGNESGNGNNFESVSNAIKAIDTSRLTHYEGNSNWSTVTSTMYWDLNGIRGIGNDRQNEYKSGRKPRPHIQCENTHSMGNSMGNQREYFNLYEQYPALAGEFIWDWKDQGLEMPVPGRTGQTYWAYGSDMNANPNDGNFCVNGVIFPDHTYSAKALNVKKIYQPADFEMTDSLKGIFKIKNKQAFRNLSHLDFSYEVLQDGIRIGQGTIDNVDVAGGQNKEVTLPHLMPDNPVPGAEYFVRFSARQREATPWAEAGYEVANEQFTLRRAIDKPVYTSTTADTLTVSKTSTSIIISGANFKATFLNSAGQLSRYMIGSKQIISTPISLNVFRVPTDNDGRKTGEWDDAGLRSLTVKPGKWNMEMQDDGSVQLTITNTYIGKNGTSFTTDMTYIVMPDGAIIVGSYINPALSGRVLPRMGFQFQMPTGYENYTYFGRGPWDNYRDRKESCHPGIYHSTVTDQWTPFIKPQETGNKEDMRFISLTNNDGMGMMVVAPQQMSATVGHWNPTTIYTSGSNRKNHPHEVTFDKVNYVSIDAAMRGLGNASCGPDVLDKYELYSRPTEFHFILIPQTEPMTDEQLADRARVTSPLYTPMDRSAWSIVSYDSQQGGAEVATNAIDGNGSTIWHTTWSGTVTSCPHEIVLDLGNTYSITAFTYRGRSDSENGRIRDYELYVSHSPLLWGNPASVGQFENISGDQTVSLSKPVAGRYVRLIARSEVNGREWTSVAEMDVSTRGAAQAEEVTRHIPEDGGTYLIRDTQTGLYLRGAAGGTAGHFTLAELAPDDKTFVFKLKKQKKFTSYYQLMVGTRYMTKGTKEGILQLGSSGTAATSWIQLEAVDGGYNLRTLWNGNNYLGFQNAEAGAAITSNQAKAAVLELIPTGATGITDTPSQHQQTGTYYDLNGRPATIDQHGIVIGNGHKVLHR